MKNKIQQEQMIVEQMIRCYCKGNHKDYFCKDCQNLLDYAKTRIEKCPFIETKSFCSNCKIHCYRKEEREYIRKVMKYSGPRLIFHHPWMVLMHGITSLKERIKNYGKK